MRLYTEKTWAIVAILITLSVPVTYMLDTPTADSWFPIAPVALSAWAFVGAVYVVILVEIDR
jgi:hypothetical protein